jgi:hypothetical protein
VRPALGDTRLGTAEAAAGGAAPRPYRAEAAAGGAASRPYRDRHAYPGPLVAGWSYLEPPPLPRRCAHPHARPTLAPMQVTIALGSAIAFSRLDASQTSRPHVFL